MGSPSRSVSVTVKSLVPTRPGETLRAMSSVSTVSLKVSDCRSSANSRDATCRAGSMLVSKPTAARIRMPSTASPTRKRRSQFPELLSVRNRGRTHTRFSPPRKRSGSTSATLAIKVTP